MKLMPKKTPFSSIFLFILLSNILFINSDPSVYQSIYYIHKDDSLSPPRHYLGIRNFSTANERRYFKNGDIQLHNSFIRVRVDRDDETTGFVYNGTFNKFNKQFSHYFPSWDLKDPRGGYYFLEDNSTCIDFAKYCEVRFYVTYYQSYKAAKFKYETEKAADGTKKIAFGGMDGLITSTDGDTVPDNSHFLYKYMHNECTYEFGILGSGVNQAEERKYVYLETKLSTTNDFMLPLSPDDSTGTTGDCGIAADTDTNHVYVPSEFYVHCKRDARNGITQTVCANDPDSLSNTHHPHYFKKLARCTHEGRTYLKLENLTVTLTPGSQTVADMIFTGSSSDTASAETYTTTNYYTLLHASWYGGNTSASQQAYSVTYTCTHALAGNCTPAYTATIVEDFYFLVTLVPGASAGASTTTSKATDFTTSIIINFPEDPITWYT
mmetsp:Transcript_3584/g.3613  ORF Transcript_3584/g.3613 Transcript_3584/m.3613 type:complete len:437 (+) Transcript_3584:1-1311(+)